jgi:hypothetical protein
MLVINTTLSIASFERFGMLDDKDEFENPPVGLLLLPEAERLVESFTKLGCDTLMRQHSGTEYFEVVVVSLGPTWFEGRDV